MGTNIMNIQTGDIIYVIYTILSYYYSNADITGIIDYKPTD